MIRLVRNTLAVGLAVVFVMAAAPVAQARMGLRGGMSVDPDQFVGGIHFALSPIGKNLYIVPSAEAGFGDDLFSLYGNGDLHYVLKKFYFGGGATIWYADPDAGDSDTNVGVTAIGGIMLSKIFLEAKAGFGDMPDWKFMVGLGL